MTTMLKPAQVAEELNVPVDRVRHWIRGGYLPAVNLAKGKLRPTYRISRKNLDRFLAGCEVPKW